jgi:YHS domain-containing protein
MKNLFLMLILFISVSFAQDNSNDKKKETAVVHSDSTVADGKIFNSICPVSTEDIDPEITYEYKGKTYAVCCNNCLKKFKKDPEKYISKLSDDGKSIKKKTE